MKFEERIRELAREIVENEAPDPVNVDWTGRDDLKDLNTPETALLVAGVIAAAREVYESHCDPHPGEDDVLAERAGIDRLGRALAEIDAAYEPL